ncbi:hypothetical protein JW868_02335 [Candidatus Woesearchaeota archaeon]|nr:hypothetical protein [Candidatus Woesearchaeota archaeon]
MNKQGKMALISAFIVLALVLASFAMGARAKKACSDGVDNDGDGYIDTADPGCANKNDNSEWNPAIECDDGVDNDGDSATDYNDAGCSGPTDTDETNCGDGVCEGGESSGTCPADCGYPDSCDETDGGNYPAIYGYTYGYLDDSPYTNYDYCEDSSYVYEYYCSGDYSTGSSQSCGTDFYGSNYCYVGDVYHDFTDYFCSDGACDSSTTPVLVEECQYGCTGGTCDTLPDSCSDSDYGYNYWVTGTVSGYLNEMPYNNTDYCVGETYVYEYYCIGDYAYGTIYNCDENSTNVSYCSSGRCMWT